jgi:FKBP-type peptidyl-prolyl cis-trans isomerase SlyD
MEIGPNSVVVFDYTLRNDAGEVLDSSDGSEPLIYLHGHGQIVSGLEAALTGKKVGDKFKAVVPPEEGYGEAGEGETVTVPREELPPGPDPEVGMELSALGPDGEEASLWITEVNDQTVTLTADHPLAGVTLHFDVEVKSVRAATAEELAHGHAHDGDGHGHGHGHMHH